MNKWDIYKNFNYWKDQKIYELQREYESGKNCGDSMRSTDDISFEDFCVGKWQRL